MSADDSDFDKVQWQAIADENVRNATKTFPKTVLACEFLGREVGTQGNRKGVKACGLFRSVFRMVNEAADGDAQDILGLSK